MTRAEKMPSGMEDELRISAIIPTYNREHLIGRAIESALRQSKRPAEIIVVDDGSSDGTREKVAAFAGLVKYIYQSNSGVSIARNRGVREAKSEWIAFLDSDDLWLETHLERMARAIYATSGVARIYFGDTIRTTEEGSRRLWEICNFSVPGDYQLVLDATQWVMMRRQPMMLQSSVFKRQTYLDSGGLWQRLQTREDTHLFLKLGIGGSVCAVTGCSTRMTLDARPHNRLTSAHDGTKSSGYRMQVMMYQDVLGSVPNIRLDHKRELRKRLAAAHLRLARRLWNEHRPLTAALQAGRGAFIEPKQFLRDSYRIIARLLCKPKQLT